MTVARGQALASYQIKYTGESERELWDAYVRKHPDASLYHLFGWRDVIRKTYGHETYYLMLVSRDGGAETAPPLREELNRSIENVVGVLPLVHLKHIIFGNRLVSLPFVDGGGILANCRDAEASLLSEAVKLGRELGAATIELRHERFLASFDAAGLFVPEGSQESLKAAARFDKVRMLLTLPPSSRELLASFKSKLRNQINRPLNEGFDSGIGGLELLEDFYKVFLVNMRDLGSPVHSAALMRNVLREFPECSRVVVIYKSGEPVASALVVGFREVLRNPWASSLREYALQSPNMLLYLRMLEHACDNGYRVFDFGRSTRGEGTYKFKEQWGAAPAPLHWTYISLDGKPPRPESAVSNGFVGAKHYWKRLPLAVTKFVGPRIRKHIGL